MICRSGMRRTTRSGISRHRDVERTFADPTRSAAELDFRPSTPFAEGVARHWAWMRSVEALASSG